MRSAASAAVASPGQRRRVVQIPGWPVVDAGLLMVTVDNVVFMHLDDRMTDVTQALYMRALEAAVAHREPDVRVAVLYDIPTFGSLRAMAARGSIGELLRRHRDTLRETTACFAVVTSSAVVRAAVQATFAVSRPAFPQRAFARRPDALTFISTLLPEVMPAAIERRISDELAAYERRLGG